MTVVGVAQQGFHGIDWSLPPDLWVPTMMKARITPNWNGLDERHTRFLHIFGRLKPGLAPAFYAASAQLANAIKQPAAGVAGGLGLRKALVVGQFALALILLVGAGLFSQTPGSLRERGPGYMTTNRVIFRLTPLTVG